MVLRLMGVPTHVHDLAVACQASVQATIGVALDLEPETLPILDHYATKHGKSERAEILGLVAPMCGAYFGEVLRRRFDDTFRWHTPESHDAWRLEGESVFLCFNPIGAALEVIEQSDAAGWGAHLQVHPRDQGAVKDALELFGDVRSRDYYSFTVRYEVFEQVVETLIREARGRGEERKLFETRDYEAFLARE